jgi:flagellar operon protein
MAEINGIKVPFIPIVEKENNLSGKIRESGGSFKTIFEKEVEKVKFSNHALQRLNSRNIQLSDVQKDRISDAVNRAEGKGSKDSLVIMDDTAFIVNIPNKTVVTAMNITHSGSDVFTNIDSVVLS